MSVDNYSLQNQCRTCLCRIMGLKSLSQFVIEEKPKEMTYAQLLKEVTNINAMEDQDLEMPQFICCSCSDKLVSCHAFIKQAKETNDKCMALLNGKKLIVANNNKRNLEWMEETGTDSPLQCFEIKKEIDDMDQEFLDDMRKENVESSLDQFLLKNECLDETIIKEEFIAEDSYANVETPYTQEKLTDDGLNSDSSQKDDLEVSQTESEEEIKHELRSKNCGKSSQRETKNSVTKTCEDEKDADIAVTCLSAYQQNHMRTLHDKISPNGLLPAREKNNQCDLCPRKYANKKHLTAHIREKHSGEECNAAVTKTRSLCFVCGASFSKTSHLNSHLRRHNGETPFKCDMCEKAFTQRFDLNSHRRVHTGEKPYKCEICSKTFRDSHHLCSHRWYHKNERPHKCKQCELSFRDRKHLKSHIRVHTGERPYTCTVCGRTYKHSNSLKIHRKNLGHMGDNNS